MLQRGAEGLQDLDRVTHLKCNANQIGLWHSGVERTMPSVKSFCTR